MRIFHARSVAATVAIGTALSVGMAVGTPAMAATRVTSRKVTATTLPPPAATITARTTTVAAVKNGANKATTKVYSKPDATSQVLAYLANGVEVKGRVVFTVADKEGEWLKVNAPIRPNGAQGWIKASEVTTYTHDYYVLIELAAKRISVYKGTKLLLSDKAGVGKSTTPTPLGSYYTTELIKTKKKNSPYGPFAFGISAFSEVFQTFGGGDGRVGMHGTNSAASVGQASTNGCIRLQNTIITKLRNTLPLGVPVDIVA
jgi:lipoprotein-anchoring transpeptidase ErfK/SrfK